MAKERRAPIRKCIVCGAQKDKKDLIRIVKSKDEGVFVDQSYKRNGRGAYVCNNQACFETLVKTGKLKHAFKTMIDDSIYDEIKEIIEME